MDRGYIKLWRRTIDSAVFANEQLLRLWLLCLMKANFKKSFVDIDGVLEPVEIGPGQFVTGRFSLHGDYYGRSKKSGSSSPQTVWRWLQTLEKLGNLNIKSYNKYSVITIQNWSEYQCNEQHVNNTRTTDEQHVNTSKECKESKEGLGKKFTPPSIKEVESYCSQRGNGVDPQRWHDFYSSKGWMVGKNKMKDWKAAVRTWEKEDGAKRRDDGWNM